METTALRPNPLARLAESIPANSLRGASVAARLFGAGLALLVAFQQSYDPTQAFTIIVALLVLATMAPLIAWRGDVAAGLGAGVVFFAGTVLTHLGPGLSMLAVGLLGGAAAMAFAYRNGRDATLPGIAFIAAALLTGPLQAGIVFWFE